jgi:hypothetical protein
LVKIALTVPSRSSFASESLILATSSPFHFRTTVGAARLGFRPDASPACAHGGAGRRPVTGRIEVDRMLATLFLTVEVLSALFRRLFPEMLVGSRK